jgi:hypothetical protein
MPKDLLQTDDGDLKLVNGDIVYGESTQQHQRDIMLLKPGDNKMQPDIGVDFASFIEGDDMSGLLRTISLQFAKDGMKVNKVTPAEGGIINIDAAYK